MESAGVQVVMSPEVYMAHIKMLSDKLAELDARNHDLEMQLSYGKELFEKILESPLMTKEEPKPHQENTKKAKRIVTPETNTYSDFKSDGKRKAHAADAIRSYDDFKAIQDYFLKKNDIRDWMMWTIGVSLGLRVSDLLSLKFNNFIETDKITIKKRIEIYEKKTGKLNNLLITESVKCAILKYIKSIKYNFDLDGYLFASKKTGGKMYEEHGWRILSNAGKALGLPIVVGSHTMRKSFANIAACVDSSCVDMNAITKVQGLLNHSDQRVTMKYLGTYQNMYDKARIAVSDFVLGKTGINKLIAGSQYSVDDVVEKLEILESMLSSERG